MAKEEASEAEQGEMGPEWWVKSVIDGRFYEILWDLRFEYGIFVWDIDVDMDIGIDIDMCMGFILW